MSIAYAFESPPARSGLLESRWLLVLGSLSTLAAGVGVYVVFRPEGVVGLAAIGYAGEAIWRPAGGLSSFGVHSFPGLLWVLSATLGQAAIWMGPRTLWSRFWLAMPLIIGCFWEAGQATGALRGTADLADLVACLIGWGLGMGVAIRCDTDRI